MKRHTPDKSASGYSAQSIELLNRLSTLPQHHNLEQMAEWLIETFTTTIEPDAIIWGGPYGGASLFWLSCYLSTCTSAPLDIIAEFLLANKQSVDIMNRPTDGVGIHWLAVYQLVTDYHPIVYNFLKQFNLFRNSIDYNECPNTHPGQSPLWLAMHAIANYRSAGRVIVNDFIQANVHKSTINWNAFPPEQHYHGQSIFWLAFKALSRRDSMGFEIIKSMGFDYHEIHFDSYPYSGKYRDETILFLAFKAATLGLTQGIEFILKLNPSLLGMPLITPNTADDMLTLMTQCIDNPSTYQKVYIKLSTILATTPLQRLLKVETIENLNRLAHQETNHPIIPLLEHTILDCSKNPRTKILILISLLLSNNKVLPIDSLMRASIYEEIQRLMKQVCQSNIEILQFYLDSLPTPNVTCEN